MLAVSPELRAALDGSHGPIARLVALNPDHSERDAWQAGPEAIVMSGSVTCDRLREIRRELSLELLNTTGSLSPKVLGDPFHPGSLVRFERGANGIYVPLFTGVITDASPSMAGGMGISAQDRFSLLQQQFGEVVVLEAGERVGDALRRIMEPVLGTAGPAWQWADAGRTIPATRATAEDDDRLAVCMAIAADAALELVSGRLGEPILRPRPDATSLPVSRSFETRRVVTLAEQEQARRDGVSSLMSLDRGVAARPYNRHLVIGEPLDGPVVRGMAQVTDPDSPLWIGYGIRQAPIRRSAAISRQDVADAAAKAELPDLALREESIGAVVLPDPTLDEGDVCSFVEPISGTDAREMLDRLTIPATLGTMSLTARRVSSLFAP